MKSSRTLVWLVVVLVAACFAPTAHAALGTCDTAGPIEIESTGGTTTPTAYATLGAAFTAINGGTHTGIINVEVCGNTTEAATSSVLNASGSGSASYTSIAIKPAGGAARTISAATTAGSPMIDFSGADNVTVDGLNDINGNALTITNTTASTTTGTSTIRFINGATSNTITNTTVLGSFSAAVGTNGGNIYFATDATTTNGNDNNTISNCNLGPAGATLPTKAVYINGTTTATSYYNSGIVITGNNIYDFFGPAVSSAGIYIAGGSTDETISNNKFYQTATRTQTTGAQHSAIWIANTSGNNYVVSGNTIGYASSTGTGTYTFVGASSSSLLIPIYLSVGTTTATSVQGNTIAGIAMSGAVSGTGSSAIFRGIYVSSGLTTIGDVTGNTIGSQSATGSITFTSSSSSASDVVGIYNFGSSAWTVKNNTIGGVTLSNSSTGAVSFYGIRVNTGSGVAFVCQNNVIGGSVANSILDNSTATTTVVHGIDNVAPAGTITGNTVRNMTAAGGTGTGTSASVVGIYVVATSANHTVSQNSIYNLGNSNTTAAVTVTGLVYGSSTGTNLVARNLIHSLSTPSTSASATINGILVNAGTATYQNNMIDLGNGITVGAQINGVNETSAGTDNFYFNSVFVGGTGVTGTANTFAFQSSITTNTRAYRDNIFWNARSNGTGTGKHYAIRVGGTAANPAGLTSNNNLLYVSGVGGYLGLFNAVDQLDLTAWRAATGQDANSFSSDPKFIDPTGATAINLHIDPLATTVIEGNGAAIGSVTDDFDGDVRANFTPTDIGADAGNFIGIDLTPPAIAYTALGNTSFTTNRTLAVTVTDLSGVPTSGAGLPVLYLRKGTSGAFTASPCTYVSGSSYSCLIDYSLVGGVVTGDKINYYVAAQDTANNVTTVPLAGAAGFTANPPAAATPPTTPNSYTIAVALSGTKRVCAAGCDYPTLTVAGGLFEAVNNGVLTGDLLVQIDGDLAAETGAVGLNQWGEDGAGNYTLTIVPTGAARTITAVSGSSAVLRILGADRVTINGSIDGAGTDRSLTISNPTTGTTGVGVLFLGSAGTGAGATNDTIKNCIIKGGTIGTTSVFTFGVFVGDQSGAAAGADNDNFTFTNNQVLQVRTGLQMVGTAAGLDDNTTITNNLFGDATLTNSIGRVGMTLQVANNANVSGNTIKNIFLASDSSSPIGMSLSTLTNSVVSQNTITGITGGTVVPAGLAISTASTGNTISQNTIDDIKTTGSGDPIGMSLGNGFTASTVTRNRISNIVASTTGGYGGRGIVVDTASTTSNLTLSNNAIWNIKGDGWNVITSDVILGIKLTGTMGGINLYHNSVYLGSGTFAGNASGTLSAALYVASTVTAVDLRDNVFATNLVNSAATAKTYAVYSDAPATSFTNIDFNDYYASGTQGVLGFITAADRATLGAWQTATGKDAASLAVDPLFNSATNLQPQTGSPVIAAGTPIAAVTVDLLGVARSATNPSIGAYETAVDTSGPVITYTPLGNTTSTASRTLTVTATDGSGVPTSGIGLPQVYFRKGSAGAFTGNQCLFIGGTTYDCVVDTSLLGGVTAGDIVQYYVAAQDTVGNVSVSPPAGAAGFTPNPPAASTPPTTPSSYTVATAITGTYNVGPGETYTSLTNAGGIFEALNNGVLTGNTVIDFTGDLTAETGAVALSQLAEEGVGGYTLTFKPAGVARTISGSSANPLIKLNGADRVTFDGSLSGGTDRSLTVTNTNSGTSTTAVFWIASASAANGATNDTIKNCIITGNGTTTTVGAILAGSGTTVGSAAEAPNSNNTIQNNLVTKAQNAVFINGATALDQNWTVTGNTFGSTVAIEKLGFRGVFLANAQNFTVTGNTILGVTTSTTSTTTGIQLNAAISGGTITRNRISDVKNTNSGGYGANGINLGATSTTSAVLVANNVIYDVAGYGYSSGVTVSDNGYGIIVTAGGGYAIHFNSIRLTTNQTTGGVSAALNVASTVTAAGAIDLRDNIIANTETTGTRYAIYVAAASTVFTDINYNDYFSSGDLGYIGSAARTSLAAWQGQTGKDMNSIAADPAFISTTDLRIGQASPAIGAGTPVASVPTDFVGVTRNVTTPTLGAYEQGAAADLAVTQRADNDPVAGGTTVTYTVTVTNNGAVPAATTKLTDTVPAHMTFVSVTPPAGWTCAAPSGGTYDCTTASLAPAAPAEFTIVYRADWCTTALSTHTVSVSTTTGDSNMADNTSSLDSNITDPGSCDDGNACTLGDSCVAGACVGAPKDCSDGSLCTTDSCDTVTGACSNAPITCNDNNTCTDDSCNAATGCEFTANDTNTCSDGSVCTTDDHCSAGSCVGTQPNCDDGNGCTNDSCNPTSGACVHTNAANACDDENACTSGDVCAENGSFAQNFDGVTAPALPAGWTTAVPEGLVTDVFTTVTDFKDTAPNAAWAADTDSVSDKNLTTPAFTVATATTKLYFMHKVDLERSGSTASIYDGAVLEISIAGGAFTDFVTAGGTFETGAYTGPITATANPLYPRNCWTGATTGFVQVKAAFPAGAVGQSVQLRWRVGTDGSVGHTGYWLDSVRVAEEAWTCHSGTPVVCNDADACTDDACNTKTGCFSVPVVVDDSNPCTLDSCDTVTGVAHVPGNAGTLCRGAAGACDNAEVCDGVDANCPADTKSTAVCRAAAGLCDVAEACDGVGNDCPADVLHPAGFSCRAAAGDCDVAELCDGSTTACPEDGFQPATTECRPSAGVCDVADFCSGAAASCGADVKSTAECRAAAGVCDVAEACDGVNNACPADQGLPLNYTYYADNDGDAYGNPATAEADCRATAPAGRSADNTDCNDANAAVHPGATEVAGDGVDEDCNGTELCYTDADHDSYGTTTTVASANLACNTPGEAAVGTDCNDSDAAIHPGAVEHCDSVDENCDGFLNGPQADADCQEQPADMTCTTNTCSAVGVCTISGVTCSVSGHVFYYRDSTDPDSDGTLEDSSTKGVPGVTLDLTGDATGSATSSADGSYSVPAGGSYTLALADLRGQFTKPADVSGTYQDGISSLDATYASKSVVALKTLSPRQLLAADVTGNGRVTSFDASLIAQKAVGLISRFPVATLGGFDSDWALAPRQRIGTVANASAADVDFVGVLFGDVTGNWGELASSFAANQENGTDLVVNAPVLTQAAAVGARNLGTGNDGGVIRIGGGGVRQATLYLAAAPTHNADGTWTVVLGLSNADGILGLDLGISMDPQYGRITGIRTTGIASDMHAQSNDSAGTRAVSLFGVTPMAGTGEFLVVTLATSGNTVGQITVSAEANEGQIPLVIDNALRVMGSQQ